MKVLEYIIVFFALVYTLAYTFRETESDNLKDIIPIGISNGYYSEKLEPYKINIYIDTLDNRLFTIKEIKDF